jgi:plastocyanin
MKFVLLFSIILGVSLFFYALAAEPVVVQMNEQGFDPSSIHVQQGQEVIFRNIGNEHHWPASDHHPSHSLYSGTSLQEHCGDGAVSSFDSCESISPGESWSFVFERPGVYTYHDHNWPWLVGEIVVESEQATSIFSIVRAFIDRLLRFFGRSSEVSESIVLQSASFDNNVSTILIARYEEMVRNGDPRQAIQALREESARNDIVSGYCHDVLHAIGHVSFEKYGGFREAVVYQEDFCNSGYIHGLFETYFTHVDNPLEGLPLLCDEYGDGARAFDRWQCHHGIGHGFMYYTGGDLDASLILCDEYLSFQNAEYCRNGVYMEVFNAEVLAKEQQFVDSRNPIQTCRNRSVSKDDCYLYVPTYFSQTLHEDFLKIFERCEYAEFGYQQTCVYGVGSEAMKRNMSQADNVFALCRQAGSRRNQEACVSGAVGMYINQQGSLEAGKDLCERASSEFQAHCRQRVNEKAHLFE